MACTPRDDDAVPTSSNDAQSSAKFHSSDAAPDWRSWDQLEASPVSTSPPCWESEDDDDSGSSVSGPRPSDLYGKFTWKIESFSHISKRELRSNVFEVGGYKWYILVYPQGCDVCNHLSLFLCVADYDKLLPGWSHFAQFTIAVVNKDPKKSKYSDTLHRFCKKEHDWGWKKFMELSKVLDGFTVADTLVIKAQVQVIRENPHRPFRCLDCQYRRELVRVYLTNVEGICRRFVEEKREKLSKLMEDTVRWSSFRAFWSAVEENARRCLAREKTDVVLKAVVKRFFNEKEVTSTLVMDALYSGCKALDLRSRNKKGKSNGSDIEETSKPVVWMDKDVFVLAGDVLSLLERAATELLPPYKDDKGPQNRTKDASSGDDFGRDSVERDERRLTELGRCTIEMFVLAHLFSNHVEVAYCEAIALKRQEELIREEEAAGQAEIESKAKREAAEKEKRTKKKQAKQRRNNRKERDKDAEEKRDVVVQEPQRREDSTNGRVTKGCNLKGHEISSSATLETGDEEDELSGLETTDDVVGTLGPAVEDGDGVCTIWEREGSDLHHGMEASFSEGFCENLSQNGRSTRKRQQVLLDDSSSTCSSDSLPSVSAVSNGSLRGRSILPDQNHSIINRGRARLHNEGYDKDLRLMESDGMLRVCLDAGSTAEPSSSGSSAGLDPEMVIASLRERVQWLEQRLSEKEEEVVILQAQLSLYQHQMGTERPNQDRGPLDESTDQCEIIGTRDVGPSGPSVCCNGRSKSPAAIKSNESRLDVPGNSVVSNNGTHIHGVNPSGIHLMNEPSRHHHDNGVSDDQPRFSAAACEIAESNAVSQGSSASNLLTLKCSSEETVSASPSHTRTSLNGMISVMELSRPSSAPVLVATPRPSLPVLQLHSAPPLSRSVSAAGRLGHVTTETVTSSSSAMMQSPPVTPSYRNAAAGKMRSGNSPSQVATIASTSWPSPYMNAFAHVPRQIPSTLPCTAGSISQSSPFPQKTPFVYGQAVPMAANNVKADGTTDTTWATVTSAPEAEGILRENCLGTSSSPQSDSARTSMGGITFGTITPEMLHARRQQDQQNDCHSSGCNAEANSYTPDCHQPDYEINRLLQQLPQEQTAQEFSYHHQDSQCNSHSKAFQKYHYSHPQGLSEGGPCNYDVRHALATVAENVNSGHMLSEEFPHLDIINDLLDEDKNFGKALSVFLQQPNLGHNCLSSFHELQRLNAGQLRLETGSVHGNGYNDSKMGMTCNDDCLQLHSTEECTRTGLRDGMQVLGPFAHSPLVRSFIQHGPIDGISRHHWPGVDNTFPVTGNANGVQSGMDHIGYPVQSHNIPVAECSAFSLGQNGYSMYSPMKQM